MLNTTQNSGKIQGESVKDGCRRKKKQKRFHYQIISLPEAIRFVAAIVAKFEAPKLLTVDEIAVVVDRRKEEATFKRLMASLRRYGLIELAEDRERYAVTTRGLSLVNYPEEDPRHYKAYISAFQLAPFFSEIMEKFPDGLYGRGNKRLENYLHFDCGMPRGSTISTIIRTYIESREVKAFEEEEEKTYEEAAPKEAEQRKVVQPSAEAMLSALLDSRDAAGLFVAKSGGVVVHQIVQDLGQSWKQLRQEAEVFVGMIKVREKNHVEACKDPAPKRFAPRRASGTRLDTTKAPEPKVMVGTRMDITKTDRHPF